MTAGNAIELAVTEPAQDGTANEAVLRFVSTLLDVPSGASRLGSGATRREKVVEVAGADVADARRRILEVLP